ncbi:c-type cytochrome [Pseudovibrio brasiliensis]|uniref:C-type cytochrome n=1 Tax=Pseudovibrio brasiliensis TaxID=1898042 RepID=A0ABX8AST3_9HYPH|nr:c-type cytochrome [Pseudovibrio brasiliensis]QUS56721.1 c-type cytochrome [Pseudovibrio brasiliensis]
MLKFLSVLATGTLLLTSAATAGSFNLGRAATPAEVAAWNIDVRPDGQGLPAGRGNVEQGEEIFAERCAVCHGDFAEGVDRWPVLSGGDGTLTSERPVKTIGSYWPYLSTVFDYVNRAMPFGEAQSLKPDEVYAITAFLLYANDLVEDDFELSQENFTSVRLPNEDGFYLDDREESPVFKKRDVCMKDCKAEVKITARAQVLDVTPEETKAAEEAAAAPKAPKAEEVASAEPTPAAEPAPSPEPVALDEALIKKGAKVFKKCKACHQVGEKAKNKVGPILNDIIGQQAAVVSGFKYSKALKQLNGDGLVWSDENLDAFLTKPKKFVKGTKMTFAGLKKEKDRVALIEFLKSHSQ